ncbi:MAG TPA: hypothetical protein VK065_03705, partial [Brevibacterium sp.]|nr:hypothetical protein [Brevibacterium sp.]
ARLRRLHSWKPDARVVVVPDGWSWYPTAGIGPTSTSPTWLMGPLSGHFCTPDRRFRVQK